MGPTGNARRLRRQQTKEEKQLWRALKAGRFAGFKFRRQHPLGQYFMDFYCPLAKVAIELDGFSHGSPQQLLQDQQRDQFLASQDVEVLRFWNHQWRKNRDGILLEIWHALYRRTGCLQVMRKESNNRFVPPELRQIPKGEPKPLPRPRCSQ
jgi:very-short-patch-repair endonuclease